MVDEKTINVEGMTCTGCEDSIQRALGRLEGVVDAKADHEAGTVAVRFDADVVGNDDLEERIRAAGYEVA